MLEEAGSVRNVEIAGITKHCYQGTPKSCSILLLPLDFANAPSPQGGGFFVQLLTILIGEVSDGNGFS
jgi:hypothetical protein